MYRDDMVDKIRNDLIERFAGQPDSRAASDDEVKMAYLLAKVDELYQETESLKGDIECMNE